LEKFKNRKRGLSCKFYFSKLHGLDLTHVGVSKAKNLEAVDYTGSFNAQKDMFKGKDISWSKLRGLELTNIGILEASVIWGVDYTGSVNAPKDMFKGKDIPLNITLLEFYERTQKEIHFFFTELFLR